ncbi:cupin domain-containing protein [Mucilaginibacter segetis]|uniref:Cupin domain-containing protein n=1 Tax=Mucilaginibacter segetis TaxID=2793071 RepID=A0A934PQS9_9SPHI|nr:cupin domain-containing protein [Mucilaginibacter segetis]MBK0378419.1 cupin domain-containing protein [Mucilaginibacter segetis]
MSLSSNDIIDLGTRAAHVTEHYANFALSEVNDHVVRMGVMTEDFYWHYHPNSDETFLVVEGTLLLDTDGQTLELQPGQMITVPKNIPHRTRPKGGRSVNITIELTAMQTVRIER